MESGDFGLTDNCSWWSSGCRLVVQEFSYHVMVNFIWALEGCCGEQTKVMSLNRPFDTLPASVWSLSWSSFASYMALPKLSELPGNVGHKGILAAGCFVTNDTESTIVHDLYGFWLSLRSMWNIHNEIQNLLEIQVAPQTITVEPKDLTALYW